MLNHLKLFPSLWKYFARTLSSFCFKLLDEGNETSLRESWYFFSMIISLVEILVEMELFSRKLSSTDNEEIWFPIFSLFDCIKILISLTLNCETISIRNLILSQQFKVSLFFKYPIFGFKVTRR